MPAPTGNINQYDVVLIGPEATARAAEVRTELSEQVQALGLSLGKEVEFHLAVPPAGPRVVSAIWAAGPGSTQPDHLAFAEDLLGSGGSVFPVLDSLKGFSAVVPAAMQHINGAEWSGLEGIIADVLRSLRLVPSERQAFISYKRSETQGVASQLFSALALRGFRPFLDTASVPRGVDFQQSLWCRMAGADLLIFLDSPHALDSTWVHQELARANDLGLGTLQLLWPGHARSPGSELCQLVTLRAVDFEGSNHGPTGQLTTAALDHVLERAEIARIRALALRFEHVVGEVLDLAALHGLECEVEPLKAIRLTRTGHLVGQVLPVVGLPDARILHQREVGLDPAANRQQIRLTYNGLGAAPDWLEHLDWLNARAGLRSEQIDNLDAWMATL